MSETFRGDVVRTAFSHGVFWERLIVDREAVTLTPWFGQGDVVHRTEVQAVEFVKIRIPFVWKTLIRFRFADGTIARRMFVAIRTNHVRRALQRLGWPVRDLKFMRQG
ncbi:MAG TPA: hypothetical protein VG034_10135 [Acidimicrobiia bacterium]|nr:hypothetical protein [Acidimicrobiia bacterium]